MRVYQIALFILLFNFSCTYIDGLTKDDGTPIFNAGSYEASKSAQYDRAALNETLQNMRAFQDATGVDTIIGGATFLYQGFMTFVNVIVLGTIKFPLMLAEPPFDLPDELCAFLLAGMVVVYIAGLIEFFSSREVGA